MTYIDKETGQESLTNYTDMVISRMNYGLDFDQQLKAQTKVLDDDCKNVVQIACYVYNAQSLEKDSPEVYNVKRYVAKVKRILAGGKQEYDFSEEQLARIQTLSGKGISATDITLDLFPNLSGDIKVKGEMKSIVNYCKAIGQFHSVREPEQDGTFRPPEAQSRLVKLINDANSLANYPLNSPLNSEQRKNVNALRSYLRSPRFVSIANTIPAHNNREVFIREFVKAVYDKPDLNSEDINSFVSLCNLYHEELNLKQRIEIFSEELKNQVHNSGSDSVTLKMNTLKAIENASKELAEIRKQQHTLQTSLSDTRARRLAATKGDKLSLIGFIERWRDEENRKEDLMIARAHQLNKLSKEIKRLDSFNDMIAEVRGVSEDELFEM